MLHALEVLAKAGYRPEYVVTLEPTSPLRTTELIDRCIAEAIRHPELDCVMTVTEARKCYGRLQDGRFTRLLSLRNLARHHRQHAALMMLLLLTAGLGAYVTSFARTADEKFGADQLSHWRPGCGGRRGRFD